jgi:hypothetical protein
MDNNSSAPSRHSVCFFNHKDLSTLQTPIAKSVLLLLFLFHLVVCGIELRPYLPIEQEGWIVLEATSPTAVHFTLSSTHADKALNELKGQTTLVPGAKPTQVRFLSESLEPQRFLLSADSSTTPIALHAA